MYQHGPWNDWGCHGRTNAFVCRFVDEFDVHVSEETMNFAEAYGYCFSRGSILASIHSAEQNEIVRQKGTGWFGLTDQYQGEGNWMYIDNTPATYTNWAPHEPNNSWGNEHCAEVTSNGYWNDINCNDNRKAICKA